MRSRRISASSLEIKVASEVFAAAGSTFAQARIGTTEPVQTQQPVNTLRTGQRASLKVGIECLPGMIAAFARLASEMRKIARFSSAAARITGSMLGIALACRAYSVARSAAACSPSANGLAVDGQVEGTNQVGQHDVESRTVDSSRGDLTGTKLCACSREAR